MFTSVQGREWTTQSTNQNIMETFTHTLSVALVCGLVGNSYTVQGCQCPHKVECLQLDSASDFYQENNMTHQFNASPN